MSGVGTPENQCCVGVDGWCGARVLFTIVQRPLGSRCILALGTYPPPSVLGRVDMGRVGGCVGMSAETLSLHRKHILIKE